MSRPAKRHTLGVILAVAALVLGLTAAAALGWGGKQGSGGSYGDKPAPEKQQGGGEKSHGGKNTGGGEKSHGGKDHGGGKKDHGGGEKPPKGEKPPPKGCEATAGEDSADQTVTTPPPGTTPAARRLRRR